MRLEIARIRKKLEQVIGDLKAEHAKEIKQLTEEIVDLKQKLKSVKVGISKVIDNVKAPILDQEFPCTLFLSFGVFWLSPRST